MRTTTIVESGNRIQLPAAWAHELGLHGIVLLDKTADGILVRPCASVSWDAIYSSKLPVASCPGDIEVSGDDLLF